MTDVKPTLLILAAGMGSRYGGLKQVDGVGPNEEAIIEYSIFDAIRAGFGKVVFVIRESFEDAFKAKFEGKFQDKIEVAYAYQTVNIEIEGVEIPERTKPWGTGHAVLSAAHLINEPFAVINADDYYGIAAYQTVADFFKNDVATNKYAMVGFILANTLSDNGSVNRGICETDENDYLTNVVERHKIRRESDGGIVFEENDVVTALGENEVTSMNFWGFHPNVFDVAQAQFVEFVKANKENPTAEFYIPLIVNTMIQAGQLDLQVLQSKDKWFGVTYQDDKPVVVNALQQFADDGVYPPSLW